MLAARQRSLVQQSWGMVVPIADAAASLFYSRLFELDPTLRPTLAKSDMAEQRRKLMTMITMVVRGLERLDELVPAVENLGRRHARYSVLDAHYATVAEALIWTLGKGLGDAFTNEMRDAWVAVYTLLAATMQRGAMKAA